MSVHSQKQEIDSLIEYAFKTRNEAPDSVVILSDSIIESSRAIDYLEGEIQGFYSKAAGKFLLGKYEEAAESCQTVLEKLETIPSVDSLFYHKLKGSTYILQGILEQRQGNYENAITLFLKALVHLEKIEDWVNIASAYVNISENFKLVKNFDKALFYNKEAEELYLRIGKAKLISTILVNRGTILFDQMEYSSALKTFEDALEEATKSGDLGNIINTLNNLGVSYEMLGEYETALTYYKTALEQYRARKDHWGEANTMGNISMIYFTLEQFEKARQFSEKALAISEAGGFLELEKFNTENLAEILEKEGDYRTSLTLQKQARVLQDSLYNQQKFEAVNRLEKQFNEEKSNRIIAQKDRDLVKTQLHSQRLLNFAISLGIFFLVVLSGAWLFYRQAQFRKEKNEELLAKNAIIQTQNEDLESLVDAYESQREKAIKIGSHKIHLDDIIYIRYENRVSTIFLKDQSTIEQRIQLTQLMAELSYKSHFLFSQINQNYIVHFKNTPIEYIDDEEDKFYFIPYLPHDQNEYRDEEAIKTRKRSGLTRNFERDYQRYLRLKEILA